MRTHERSVRQTKACAARGPCEYDVMHGGRVCYDIVPQARALTGTAARQRTAADGPGPHLQGGPVLSDSWPPYNRPPPAAQGRSMRCSSTAGSLGSRRDCEGRGRGRLGPVYTGIGRDRAGRVRCITASKKQQRPSLLARSKTGQRAGWAERSAARGYGEHPGEAHSCPARLTQASPSRSSSWSCHAPWRAAGEVGCLWPPSPSAARAVHAPLPDWRGTTCEPETGGLKGRRSSGAPPQHICPGHGQLAS